MDHAAQLLRTYSRVNVDRPSTAPAGKGTKAFGNRTKVVTRDTGLRRFSPAIRLEDEDMVTISPRKNTWTQERGAKSKRADDDKKKTRRLGEELLALVNPAAADPHCAIFVHTWKKKAAVQAAELGKLRVQEEFSASLGNQEEQQVRVVGFQESETFRKIDEGTREEFFRAIEEGDCALVKRLLQSYRVGCNTVGSGGFSPLHIAAQSGHVKVLRFLASRSAKVEAASDANETPLHLAVYGGQTQAVEDLLVMFNANPNARTGFGETPLFYAARKGYSYLARLLIYNGADVHREDRFGETALDQADSEETRQAMIAASRASTTGPSTWQRCSSSLVVGILAFCDAETLTVAGQVCSVWRRASKDVAVDVNRVVWKQAPRNSFLRPRSSPFSLRSLHTNIEEDVSRKSHPQSARPRLGGGNSTKTSRSIAFAQPTADSFLFF